MGLAHKHLLNNHSKERKEPEVLFLNRVRKLDKAEISSLHCSQKFIAVAE